MSPIYIIGGDKDDGKSLLSAMLLRNLSSEQCFLVDTDTHNPDVYEEYSQKIPSAIIDLNTLSGWAELINTCDINSDKIIVINGSDIGIEGIEKYGKILLNHLFYLERHLVTLWVISCETKNLTALQRYRKIVGRRVVHIVKNYKYNDIFDFPAYEKFPLKEELKKTGRVIITNNSEAYDINDNICEVDFVAVDYGLKEIVGINSCYRVFTRELADEIEEALQRDYHDDFADFSIEVSHYKNKNNYPSGDIGDLLAEGLIRVEDLVDEDMEKQAQEERLRERNRLRLEKEQKRALEPETEEEYQQRAQQEYWHGGNPEGFIPRSKDIEERADCQYLAGLMPEGYIPTAEQLRKKELLDRCAPGEIPF